MSDKINAHLEINAKAVEQKMISILPDMAKYDNSKLLMAIYYGCLGKGKRVRPFLLLTIAGFFGVKKEAALNVACALEFIHIYSLIHDDLPAMDDDDLRRGEPSCHKKFDEATAILAGDALLTYAFEILSREESKIEPQIQCQIINLIAKSIGFDGMAGGQMLDLDAKNNVLNEEQINHLHNLKTGKMFVAAAKSATILAQVTGAKADNFSRYATDIGLAFQIKDDILDFEDGEADNANIVNLIGIKEAKLRLENLKNSAIDALQNFDQKNGQIYLLQELAKFIVARHK
jgi:farnesyl diphosphate synthase